jgi:hypothetical protein
MQNLLSCSLSCGDGGRHASTWIWYDLRTGMANYHNSWTSLTLLQVLKGDTVHLKLLELILLSTAKDQKALNIDSAKPTPAQQFPATVNRELGHGHDADILGADASFV